MGAGKSARGEALAKKLGWQYIDANPGLERYIMRKRKHESPATPPRSEVEEDKDSFTISDEKIIKLIEQTEKIVKKGYGALNSGLEKCINELLWQSRDEPCVNPVYIFGRLLDLIDLEKVNPNPIHSANDKIRLNFSRVLHTYSDLILEKNTYGEEPYVFSPVEKNNYRRILKAFSDRFKEDDHSHTTTNILYPITCCRENVNAFLDHGVLIKVNSSPLNCFMIGRAKC